MFSGIAVSRGIAIGDIAILRRDITEVTRVELRRKDLPAEVRRFRAALKKTRERLLSVRDGIPEGAPSEVGAFIETHILMLDDALLAERPVELIKTHSCNAESALQIQREEITAVFQAMDDPYIATRIDDVNHVIDDLMRALSQSQPVGQSTDWSEKIVIADDLTPADTLEMQGLGVTGFVTETGGQLSHTAILARSLGIPAIVGVHNIRQYLKNGETVILDGHHGILLADPAKTAVSLFRKHQKEERLRQRDLKKLVDKKSVTRDSVSFSLQANIEVDEDVRALKRVNAEGVGLYRTEFLYLNQEEPPDEEEHFKAYTRILRSLKGAPITIRTVDLGADKQMSAQTSMIARNPAMGLRGIRLCLSDPQLLLPQLRALLRASARGPINVMFPMLTNLQEVRQCLALVEDIKRELTERGQKFDHKLQIGGMIEVPAAALAADQFAQHLDFLSIGTNDLIQYTLAIDRIDDQVDYLYDPLHPAVLRLIKHTIDAGRKAKIPVGMCGEMAGDARFVRLLLGLGLTQFSMPPNKLLEIKRVLTTADKSKLQTLARQLINSDSREQQIKILARINEGLDLQN